MLMFYLLGALGAFFHMLNEHLSEKWEWWEWPLFIAPWPMWFVFAVFNTSTELDKLRDEVRDFQKTPEF